MKRFIQNDWWNVLEPEFKKPYYQKLRKFLVSEYRSNYLIHPDADRIFEAFKLTPFNKVKVVILGQDPYPEPNTAMGLSFSVMPGRRPPRSLQNIYKEMQADVGAKPVKHGCLVKWTQEGVLLLNTVLTVRDGQPNSHRGHGWEKLTDAAIKALSNRKEPVIFILWGRQAQKKEHIINKNKNVIITGAHPSPLSASKGFFGSKPFSKTNFALDTLGEKRIDWQLPQTVSKKNLKKIFDTHK